MSSAPPFPPLVILTGAYDDNYLATRRDDPVLCTSAGKRLKLYAAMAEAAGVEPLLLSPQPKGRQRTAGALPETSARFGKHEQRFCRTSRLPKLRILLNIFSYIRHVARHAPREAVVVIDNYELVYILALKVHTLLGGRARVLLEYEDGKHAIDRGWQRVLSSLAEKLGHRLVRGAILATPTLASRLPRDVPHIFVPGILEEIPPAWRSPGPGEPVEFIYSGSLDEERGIPLLLEFIRSERVPANARFQITGQGWFTNDCAEAARARPDRLTFHGSVTRERLDELRSRAHYGLNLQRSGHPVTDVTYPSKTFDYLNAGLRIVSTRAAGVGEVLGPAALYLEDENLSGLADAVHLACAQAYNSGPSPEAARSLARFSHAGTVARLKPLLEDILR